MKRSELYDRVWSLPVVKIADEVGITGTRIAAICRQHRIPTPPRGYWAKLSVGKQPPRSPLPQPESDYDIKVGKPATSPALSAWVAPGVLLRAGGEQPPPMPQPALAPAPTDLPEPPSGAEVLCAASAPARPAPAPDATGMDLELVRAAAVELQGMQAIRDLLQAVAARAMHAQPDEAQRILSWAASVRSQLDARDPIAPLLRLAAKSQWAADCAPPNGCATTLRNRDRTAAP